MINKNQLEATLNRMGYHKTTVFVNRCIVESDGEITFTADVIKEMSFAMLDRDYEQKLFKELGI